MSALERMLAKKGHMCEDMVVHLDLDEPKSFEFAKLQAEHVNMAKGQTSVLGTISDVVSKAKKESLYV